MSAAAIETALRAAIEGTDDPVARPRPALAAFVTAGYPHPDQFDTLLQSVAAAADVVEIGVPFSDPMADGVTVQRASRTALQQGVTLTTLLDRLRSLAQRPRAPLLLMSYLNPLLAYGWERLVSDAIAAGVSGLIIPDLPLEEQSHFTPELARHDLALVQLVTPITPPDRLDRLCRAARGFLYAVTVTGITGGQIVDSESISSYLARVKRYASVPVLAGFGVRTASDVTRLVPPADGVIVGSALLEAIDRGEDPASFLHALRSSSPAPQPHEKET